MMVYLDACEYPIRNILCFRGGTGLMKVFVLTVNIQYQFT